MRGNHHARRVSGAQGRGQRHLAGRSSRRTGLLFRCGGRRLMTPTARSMKYFRDRGCIVAGVEKTLHMPGRPFPMKRDAFGFGDLLVAVAGQQGIALVQVTDISSMSARRNKITHGIAKELDEPKRVAEAQAAQENARHWIGAGGRILLHGWGKRGARGKKKLWTLRREEITYIYPH